MVNLHTSDPTVIPTLASLKSIITGGVSLPEKLGNFLIEHKIPVSQALGMTETGLLMVGDADWRYMRLAPGSGAEMRLLDDNIYELVVVNGRGCVSGYMNNPVATQVRIFVENS